MSRWARRFVFAGALWLAVWQILVLAGGTHRTGVVVGLLGFVFQTVFGKAYSLVPSYFDRSLVTTRLLPVHFLLGNLGPMLLAVGIETANPSLRLAGAVAWTLAVGVFVGTLGASIRDNIAGSETGTGDASSHRVPLDRTANPFVPVAFAYLLVGTYGLLAVESELPVLVDGYVPRTVHLLGAGGAVLLLFAVGFRLLPRFLVTTIDHRFALVVLTAGALGPAVIAVSLPAGGLFAVGAALQAVAVVGYALAVVALYRRSKRDRIGFYGVLGGAGAGLLAVGLGITFALDGVTGARIAAHARLNVLGLLGLTIVGVSYQFYPPGVSTTALINDRTALVALCLLAGGLVVEVTGLLAGLPLIRTLGRALAAIGGVAHLLVVAAVLAER
ncbi:hypothetical protein GRX03_13660 [Halovenus sp. WSH3]|uniref:Uncharacterized protein n=1 Tax=Halovenus carboxidivorans TaxID=2692199 RepID=A0A6B0T6U1_9EURY|nr:hypothetical protein [Halovenus carboxidivorans]